MDVTATASIVTFNSGDVITDVLASLSGSIVEFPLEIIVVDNNSSDGTADLIKHKFPKVKLKRNNSNIGYGGGCNIAIKCSNSKYHFIINPDIIFQNDVIQKSVNYMEAHPEVALFNPDIHGFDGKRKYPPKAEPKLHYIIPRVLHWKNRLFDRWRDEYTCRGKFSGEPFEIEVCSGSFMVCRKSALDAVGGFDERFFLYYEDFDLSKRMAKEGKVMCNPQIAVRHKGKRAAYHSRTARNYMIQSMIKYYNKWGWRI